MGMKLISKSMSNEDIYPQKFDNKNSRENVYFLLKNNFKIDLKVQRPFKCIKYYELDWTDNFIFCGEQISCLLLTQYKRQPPLPTCITNQRMSSFE